MDDEFSFGDKADEMAWTMLVAASTSASVLLHGDDEEEVDDEDDGLTTVRLEDEELADLSCICISVALNSVDKLAASESAGVASSPPATPIFTLKFSSMDLLALATVVLSRLTVGGSGLGMGFSTGLVSPSLIS